MRHTLHQCTDVHGANQGKHCRLSFLVKQVRSQQPFTSAAVGVIDRIFATCQIGSRKKLYKGAQKFEMQIATNHPRRNASLLIRRPRRGTEGRLKMNRGEQRTRYWTAYLWNLPVGGQISYPALKLREGVVVVTWRAIDQLPSLRHVLGFRSIYCLCQVGHSVEY